MLSDKLGAKPLAPFGCGDDQTDLQDKFREWARDVATAVCGKELQMQDATAGDKPKRQATDVIIPTPKPESEWLPRKEYHRQKREAREKAQLQEQRRLAREAAAAEGETAVEATEDASEEDLEEEDKINAAFVDYEVDSDASSEAGGDDGADNGEDMGDVGLVDVEDLGSAIKAGRAPQKKGMEMVTALQRKALTKEGYKIIGTHSAVKLCRWTKHQLRGRGGCYKHTFYGITSYQCMEATPSLACANKCVFCWRHHKNPVGTEWRWKTDSPEMIVRDAIKLHQGMINQMRGVPGVQPERLQEAFRVAHCALSLVGEPIMYPHINAMLKELHRRDISSFMVTNAQFPEQIAALDPVTQLYVSVDAPTKESLKAIDRPLFKDFWERFHGSLESLGAKQQRTVYRLTLVSGWNMNEIDAYAELIATHRPDFIEVKAVTFCGKSDGSSLTMQNVPWHKEVCAYCEAIAEKVNERLTVTADGEGDRVRPLVYKIATEHEHSCCVLIAREDKFKVDGEWHTWIDYKKFNALITEYYASGGKSTFTSVDYMAPTPSWALYQSNERGFDPIENRYRRNKQGQLVERDYKASDSGCG